MALKISKETDDGVTVEYWRVDPSLVVDLEEKILHGTLRTYSSEASRRSGKPPVRGTIKNMPSVVRVSGQAALDALKASDARDALYVELKKLDCFKDAEDC